jgi:preflagellin peptidase FlaK
MNIELNVLICLIMLISASIMDVRKREVSDKVWIISGIAGLIMIIMVFINNSIPSLQQYLTYHALSAGIIAPLAYIIYRFGLFGGADAKALIMISLILPFYDIKYSIHNIPALVVLTNATILTIIYILHNIVRNTIALVKYKNIFKGFEDESVLRKILAFTVGFLASKPNGYLFAIESTENGKRKFTFNPNSYDNYVDRDSNDVWVTPALPFILYITLGFLIAIYVGDILGYIIHNITLVSSSNY